MKKTVFRILAGIGIAGVIIVIIVLAMFWNELRSILSLEKVDDYGMYQMTYYGDYGFDNFLEVGASSDADIEAFVTKRLLKGLPIDLGVTGDGCTAFVVKNAGGDLLFGRNFDFTYAPSLQLYTAPENGYASVSTVNLAFAGYDEDNLPDGTLLDRFLTLAAPFLPFDGMNEKGLAIALLAVPEAEQAIALLADVGVFDGDTDKLQWSVLYNLTTGEGEIFAHRKTDNRIGFHLDTGKE